MSCPVVDLKNGKVKGFATHLKCKDVEKPVYVYRSIPFAKPPIGSLRFMPPQPADQWTGIRDGTKLANRPMQSSAMLEGVSKIFAMKLPKGEPKTDEDCLYLTVYTPDAAKGKKLAVMVWLYGGGFQFGDNIAFDGSALAGMQNVVVVVPNYRVNMFGFLTLGSSSICPGNVGLLDQMMALEWVRDNINDFGGDPGNVTIFGQSSGATCVGFHLLSPLSRGLFHKAISQSGTIAIIEAIMSKPQVDRSNKKILAHFKIPETESDQKKLEALQKIPAEDLIKAQDALVLEKVYYFTVVDGNFITKAPEDALKDKDFTKVPYLLGCNSTEGSGLVAMSLGPDFATGVTMEQIEAGMPMEKNKQLMESWKKFYLKDDEGDKLRFSKFYGDLVGDGTFVYPTLKAAKCHSACVSDTFMYQGAFQLRMFHDDTYRGDLVSKVDWCECDHSDEIQLVFGVPFTPGDLDHGAKHSVEEEVLSRKVMTYFTNFAKHGDPNKGDKVEVTWPKFGSNGKYLVIDHKLKTAENLKPKMYEYWSKTVADLRKKYPEMD